MLAKLKEMFGSKSSGGSRPRPSRVNLEKRFTIVAETAQGSMSRVYRAVENQSGRTVCLKVQNREKNEAAAARADRTQRPDEGETASRIVHPNVVRTFEYGVS